jgi:hypothetical protein
MRRLLGIGALLFLSSCSFLRSPGGRDPDLLFFDDFEDNRKGWLIEETERTRSDIEHGDYVIVKKARWGASARSVECALDQQEDFLIEAVITKTQGYDDYGYGIVWGFRNIRDTYKFVITGQGGHLYGRVEYEIWHGMDVFETSGFVHPGNATNKLAVKKAGSRLFLLINDSPVYETAFEAFAPSNLGFILEDGMQVEVESILLRRLETEPFLTR